MTGERVLVVENESAVAKSIEKVLVRLGYAVSGVACSGANAIQQAGSSRPDLVLMDIPLEGAIDGVAVAGLIQKRFNVPIVCLAAHGDAEALDKVVRTASFGYLLKPFEETELGRTIEMTLFKHRMETKLRQSEMHYRIISELVSDYAYTIRIEPDGTLVCEWVSHSVVDVLGLTPAEVNAKGSVLSLIHPDDPTFAVTKLRSLLEGNREISEARIESPEGDVRWLRVYNSPVFDEAYNRVTLIVGAAQDITDRKRAEVAILGLSEDLERRIVERTAALRESEARYRAIVEDQTELVCRLLPDSSITFVNGAFCRYFGGSPADWIGRTLSTFVLDEDAGKLPQVLDSLALEEPSRTLDYRVVRFDDEIRWLQVTIRALFDNDGDVAEFQLVGRDITDRVAVQAQLFQNEKMAALGRLAASLAHEINNPLQALRSGLRLLISGSPSRDTELAYLRVARDEVERLISLMERMRDFYRPSLEQFSFVDVNEILSDILLLSRKQLQNDGIHVESKLADELPLVEIVPDQLKQVFLNMILNAVDAMPEGGDLVIETGWDDVRRRVWTSFADTGKGIPSEPLDRIFEPFQTTKPDGAGLGLSVSFGIVERFGGHIDVANQPDRGCRFVVYLPAMSRS